MKRGPPRTPTAILKRRGSWRAKTREDEPGGGEQSRPVCPAWLEPEAKKEWRRLIPELAALGVLHRVDRNALALYCTRWAMWRRTYGVLSTHGPTLPDYDADGEIVGYHDRPEVARELRYFEQLIKLGARFGMTASDRAALARPAVKPTPKDDAAVHLRIV